jgi:fused signal recognition particle receptor
MTGFFQSKLSAFANSIKRLFSASTDLTKEFEKLLVEADFGLATTRSFLSKLPLKEGYEACMRRLEELVLQSLNSCKARLDLNNIEVFMLCGANGNGKTTAIGKLAVFFNDKRVLVANCDTFRAAAAEQLAIIARNVDLYDAKSSDPASIAYLAAEAATKGPYDLLLVDTSGRMSSNSNLMQELSKISRSLLKISSKICTLLVLDASTGQAAHRQAEVFIKAAQIDGLILTKLDGSAKAGTIVGLAERYKLPVYFVSTGEGMSDFAYFNAEGFTKSLFEG